MRRFKLTSNPAVGIELRREPKPAPLVYFTPEEVEAVARALAAGAHRDRSADFSFAAEEVARRKADDAQDAEAVRIAAYTGLRRGELIALRWRDVDWAGAKLTVARAISDGVEGVPKSGRYRDVPLSDQAAAALERLSHHADFTDPDDFVLCKALGRPLNPAALGRRYNAARDAAGLRPLRCHDLRHTFGSLLVAAGIDTVSVKAAMGQRAHHDNRTLSPCSTGDTTGRRLHRGVWSEAHRRGARVGPSVTIVATVTDPSGRTVVLDAEGWDHIIRPDGQPEMEPLGADILRTIEQPNAHRNGNRPGQEWFYGAGVGPSQWIRVVVAYEDGRGRIVTAFPRRSLP